MSIETIKYLQKLKNDNNYIYYNCLIINLIGLVGLAKINNDNNKVNLKLKQYRVILNNVTDKNLDIYVIVQDLFDEKMITLSYAIRIITMLQEFRNVNNNSIDEILEDLKELLIDLPAIIKQKLSIDIKIVMDSFISNPTEISDLVLRLYNYCNRKNVKLDFMTIAKTVRRF